SFGQTNVPYYLSESVQISAGFSHDLALSADGKIAGWGRAGKLGTNGADAIAIAAGGTNYSLALRSDSTVAAWATLSWPGAQTITKVPATATNIVAISAGYTHAVAIVGTGPPLITSPIQYNTRAFAGTVLPLFVRAVGIMPLHYQWLSNDVPVGAPDS